MLQVVDSLEPGGAERHVLDLSCELARRGNAVQVACSVGGALAGELERAGICWVPLMPALVKRRSCREYAARLSLLSAGAYDVVHAHMHASAVAAAAAELGSGSALVLTEHTEAPWRTAQQRHAARQAFHRADLVLAVSARIAGLLRTGYGLPAGRVRLVPPAITPERVPAASRPASWRDRPLIGRVCRLQPEKGVDVFLRAA
ncbi:MAG TPA: glycosyltransferase family 4 protein, partial [Pseudonocardiaceae bacterium]|nr:glycosyltransferase family 4 protein [Pseudonocardiaceae bacterium]